MFLQGIDSYVIDDVKEAMLLTELYPRPLNIIEGPLMKVIILILQLLMKTWMKGNKMLICLFFNKCINK